TLVFKRWRCRGLNLKSNERNFLLDFEYLIHNLKLFFKNILSLQRNSESERQ
ncbi:unnamed protein product, partial [Brassica napus]